MVVDIGYYVEYDDEYGEPSSYRRCGGDKRGNTTDRYRRKTWMLNHFGDGQTCQCVHCGSTLNRHTLEADRIVAGGSYCHENIQPSCRQCNRARWDNEDWTYGGHDER